jgi:hypothetical protein
VRLTDINYSAGGINCFALCGSTCFTPQLLRELAFDLIGTTSFFSRVSQQAEGKKENEQKIAKFCCGVCLETLLQSSSPRLCTTAVLMLKYVKSEALEIYEYKIKFQHLAAKQTEISFARELLRERMGWYEYVLWSLRDHNFFPIYSCTSIKQS